MQELYEICQAVIHIHDLPAFFSRIKAIARDAGVHIIFLDADRMAGAAHVRAALSHALRAERAGKMISRSVEMEVLLYAGGTRQVQNATTFGIHPGLNRSYVCIYPPSPGALDALSGLLSWTNDDWEEISPGKASLLMEIFGITDRERAAAGKAPLSDLVIERVALLDINR
ncbi:MAG: KEOPS complex subunit Cgi121 [Methanoregulaceae archaeon]|nr:KEOPS complex subunit Cgi121 [Methanoregulaceae archaeon]